MQTIWFPIPVALFFRRLVNVVSTFSISHHYLQHRYIKQDSESDLSGPRASPAGSWRTFKTLEWLSSVLGNARLSIALEGGDIGSEPNYQPPDDHKPKYNNNNHSTPTSRPPDQLHTLLNSPALFDPVRKPRYPIVLCHGLYGFDVRGPTAFPILRTHYWANVLNVLRRRVGAEVIVTGVPGTGSIASRAESMDKLLKERVYGRGINFLAHSMGGLDCRHLITHVKPQDYTPLSLTTIGTPHRGSPFMDWCTQNIGLGKIKHQALNSNSSDEPPTTSPGPEIKPPSSSGISLASLPSSFTTLLLSMLDSPAYANLTTTFLNDIFNPSTPNSPHVKYFSVAGRISSISIWHPLLFTKMVLDGFEEKERESGRLIDPGLPEHERWGNDGLVTVQSARWGEYLGTLEESDHWSLRGSRGLELGVELPSVSVPGLSSVIGTASGSGSGTKNGNGNGEAAEGEPWSLGDWTKFVRAWKKEEKSMKNAGAAVSSGEREKSREEQMKAAMKDKQNLSDPGGDEVVNASTEKLSAVFDWIVDQVPSRNASSPPSSSSNSSSVSNERSVTPKAKSDLSSKADLERFYVALCKKLYDEGL